MRSWDIFDTLIARRCIFPHNVFRIMEQVTKIEGFTNLRTHAESIAAQTVNNYRFNDIYNSMMKIANLTLEMIERLKKLEIDVELDQAIPIKENLNQVKSGDVLISDMYLPDEVIQKLLDKVGLTVPVELLITSGGKARGGVFNQFKKQGVYLFHTGDNEVADVQNPKFFGFDSAHTTLSSLNEIESQLLNIDFEFTAYLREMRLKNPFTNAERMKKRYWTMFVINVAILTIFIQLIDKLQKEQGFEYLGFCGRDTYYMYQLYKKFKSDKNEPLPPCDYLYYSRKLVNDCGEDMKKYVSSRIKNRKALLIDIFGSGAHLTKLKRLLKENVSVMICSWEGRERALEAAQVDVTEDWSNIRYDSTKNNFYIIHNANEKFGMSYKNEEFNRATHNSPIKIKTIKVANKIIPEITFNEVNDTENADVLIQCMNEILNSNIKWSNIDDINRVSFELEMLSKIFHWYCYHPFIID